MSFSLRTFQPSMEGHQTSSSSGGADMRACPQVCPTNVCSKRVPKKFSLHTNQLESILLFGAIQLHNNREFIHNITLNMARFHYHVFHV